MTRRTSKRPGPAEPHPIRLPSRANRLQLATIGAGCLLALGGLIVPRLNAAPLAPSVEIVDFAFQPATVTIKQGEAVTWTNKGSHDHTVTADDGSFDSGSLSTGDAFANLFLEAGTFQYHDSIYPDRMTGTVVVTPVGATPTPSGSIVTPPPGTLPPNFSGGPGATQTASASETPQATAGTSPILPLLVALFVVIGALGAVMVLVRRR
jgi:plastocyanin